jgi:hypothetical protein
MVQDKAARGHQADRNHKKQQYRPAGTQAVAADPDFFEA